MNKDYDATEMLEYGFADNDMKWKPWHNVASVVAIVTFLSVLFTQF